jgi:TrmH family RNA methyltransferase
VPSDKSKITAVSNPQVKYARRLHRRRVREKEGRCLLEGVRLVADAAEAGASFVLGFWEATVLGLPGGEDLLRRLRAHPPLGGLFEVHPQVMSGLADTETPQGIVVVAQRPSPDPRLLLGGGGEIPWGRRTVVVLDNVRDPGNVGTVIRSADASGAAGVIYLPGTADPFGCKALRASMGSAFRVPVVAAELAVLAYRDEETGSNRGTGAGALAALDDAGEVDEDSVSSSRSALAALLPGLLRRRGFRVFVADASAKTAPYWQASLGDRTAIILGSEAEGPDPLLWAGAARIAVPMLGLAESLNVAMAASVLLYEAARKREGWGRSPAGGDG